MTPGERLWLAANDRGLPVPAFDKLPKDERVEWEQEAAVAALDAIVPGDPERSHALADEVMLAALGPEVRAAYERAVARERFWC